TQRPTKLTVRERLIETADRLFYTEGIHTVGIDRIIAERGVAKYTMNVHFRTKEDLVAEYHPRRNDQTTRRISVASEVTAVRSDGRSAVERVLSVFDELQEVISEPNFRGCAFVNAAAEYPDHGGIQAAIRKDRQWLPRLFSELLGAAGIQEASGLIRELVQLYD